MNARVGSAALAMLAGACFLSAAEVACASAESMGGLMQAWTDGFTAQHPCTRARIRLHARFSADFIDPLGRSEVQVAPYARELFAAEQARLTQLAGGAPRLVPVATGSRPTKGGTHAIVIFVNEKNPLARISLAQLREVFAREGRVTAWGRLGLTGEWAGRRISLHGMKVRRETGNPPGMKALALGETDAGAFFAGTSEEIARREYPLARTSYLATGSKPGGAVRAFIRCVLGPEGQGAVGADGQGFFPLPTAAKFHHSTPP